MRLVDNIFNSMLGNTTPMGYVSNGLVFQIDGLLDHSRIPQPIVAMGLEGIPFTEYRGTVARNNANNGWYFDGTTCLKAEGNLVPVNYATSTIEIVFKDYNGFTKNNFMFGNGRSDGNNIIAGTNNENKFVYTPDANPAYAIQPTTSIVAVSASSALGMANREKLTASGSYSFSRWGIVSIGGRPQYTNTDLYGEIYAIRVYNRQLTESEVVHNQMLDYVRFGTPLYTYYDYLESVRRAGQYIDTGIKAGGSWSVEIDYLMQMAAAGVNRSNWLMGANTSLNNHDYSLRMVDTSIYATYGRGANQELRTPLTVQHAYRYVRHKNVITVYDGDTVVASATPSLRTDVTGNNYYLFAYNNAGTALIQDDQSKRIGAVRFYDDSNVLVRDFRPAVRNIDGVSGMHEVVNDVFKPSANGINFLYGNF